MEWEFKKDPTEPGWYAVLICYDPQEGISPDAGYWDGAKWDRRSISAHGDKCASKEQAKELAYAHDPDA